MTCQNSICVTISLQNFYAELTTGVLIAESSPAQIAIAILPKFLRIATLKPPTSCCGVGGLSVTLLLIKECGSLKAKIQKLYTV